MRVRGFTQDDAHIFCRPSQLEGEIGEILSFITKVMGDFGFSDYKLELSTRPAEFLGNDEEWSKAEEVLKSVLKKNGIAHTVSAGAGAFYGPKIDIHVKDTLGRFWQCATVQLDFVLPERFALTYIEESGQQARPVMIHRAIFGSLERFLGTLIEQYAGAFPLWLSPVQAVVIPVTQDQEAYSAQTLAALSQAGLRVEQDIRRETLQARIRDAELLRVPYMLIVGKREQAAGQVAVRQRGVGDVGPMALTQFVDRVKEELEKKSA
jgi:threonyl-tRNA synthetase